MSIVRKIRFERSDPLTNRPRRFDFLIEEGAISSESYFGFRLPSADLPQELWITKELLERTEADLKEQLDILKDLKKELQPSLLEAGRDRSNSKFSRKALLADHRAERQKLLKGSVE